MANNSNTPLLDTVRLPADLRRLPETKLRQLADELRKEMIDAVSITGGHLGAGLGVVELTVALRGRLHVSAAEGVRAAVFANAGIAITSEWMFAPEIVAGTVKAVLEDWELPPMDLWAIFPTGRTPTAKARTFADFVEGVMHASAGVQRRPGPNSRD